MPTSLAVQDQNELHAADVTGLVAAWIPSQPSRRSGALEQVHSAKPRLMDPTIAAPANSVLPDLMAPESGRLQVQPPAASGAFSWSTGFGTVAAAGAFGSRSLVWSGGGGDSRTAGLLDPYVSRKVDLGPVRAPRALTESGGDVVEQFVDWNADNDNGSEVTDYIPAVRDYEVGFTPLEDDVVPLTLVPEPPGGHYPGLVERVYWRLQVSYSGTGRLRFWETPDKQRELTPSDDWQFTPHHIPWLQGQGRVPDICIEGMEMSSDEGDVSVDVSVLTLYVGGVGELTNYKQVRVAVTPVVKSFVVSDSARARFNNYPLHQPDGYGGTANRLVGFIEFEVVYVTRDNNHNIYFMQNVTAVRNDLGNREAITLLNGQRLIWAPKPRQSMPPVPPQFSGNFDFHFLDIWPDCNMPFPFYGIVPDDDGYVRTRIVGVRDAWRIKTHDYPSIPIRGWESPVAKVDILFEATMYVAIWHYDPRNPQLSTIATVKAIDWWIRFGAGEYSHVTGGMTKLYKAGDHSSVRPVAPSAGQRSPVIFNDGMEIRPG